MRMFGSLKDPSHHAVAGGPHYLLTSLEVLRVVERAENVDGGGEKKRFNGKRRMRDAKRENPGG